MITGISLKFASALIRLRVWRPSNSGIFKSSTIREGRSSALELERHSMAWRPFSTKKISRVSWVALQASITQVLSSRSSSAYNTFLRWLTVSSFGCDNAIPVNGPGWYSQIRKKSRAYWSKRPKLRMNKDKHLRSKSFDNSCDALSASDTGRNHTIFLIQPLKVMQDLYGQFSTGTTERMAKGYSTSIDINDVGI